MSKLIAATAGLAVAVGAANAAELLVVDLSVVNQVTVTATTGASSVSAAGSNTTGIYLQNFYTGPGVGMNISAPGTFTTFNNPSDGTPAIFRVANDPGFNMWSMSTAATLTFTAGQQAFTGSGTWNVSAQQYADLIALGNRTGNIWFAADSIDDLPNAVVIGTYRAFVPAPGAAALLGLGGLAAARRRR
jgi:hypothetical protein